MLKNYLKIGWRNLMKDKTFTLLNVIGLSVAFGVATLLIMHSLYELSYDKFHTNADTLYQTYTVEQNPKGLQASTSLPSPLAEALKVEMPGVDKITRYLETNALTLFEENEINFNAVWVDEDFFSMFSFPIAEGKKENPLSDLSSVVLTQATASKLFGNEEAIGKTIAVMINGEEKPFTIAAIATDNLPESSLKFEMAIRFENNREYEDTKESWNAQYHEVYLQLNPNVSAKEFEKNSHAFTNLHFKEAIENLKRDGAVADSEGQYYTLGVAAMADKHFTSFKNGYADVSHNLLFLVFGIAFLIVFIACVNFINMSIARSSKRLREIGMRKTLGAEKKQLFLQFWSESLFVFVISFGLGILLSVLLFDDFQTTFRTNASFNVLLTPVVILSVFALVLLITLVVGGYPALLLSRLGTIQSLKGKLESSGKNRLRNALMVLQFGIAVLLISGTLVLWGQVDFMRNKDLGYDKEQVFSFPLDGKKSSYDVVRLLREEFKGNSDFVSISASDNNLGIGKDGSQFRSLWGFNYKGREVKTNGLVVDYDYIETLGLELLHGRSFNINREHDNQTVIINESMAKELGEKDPLSARLPMNDSLSYPVIGVVKDYNFQELSTSIQPLTFFLDKDVPMYYAYVKVAPTNMANSFDAVAAAYKKIEPNAEFLGSFLNENVDRTFRREKTMATLITAGAVLAITLSCIGLFAMSLLVVAQRTKEIGVRKVLGASVGSITVMLTKDFLKLVCIAFLIAAPVAWWFLQKWLENYAYKIDLTIWFFAAAGMLVLAIAILTVGSRTIKAALQNPVKSLGSE